MGELLRGAAPAVMAPAGARDAGRRADDRALDLLAEEVSDMYSFERALRQLVPASIAGCLIVTSATAGPIDASVYRTHVAALASDEFDGRKPGTAGETRTLQYLEGEFRKLGLEPA